MSSSYDPLVRFTTHAHGVAVILHASSKTLTLLLVSLSFIQCLYVPVVVTLKSYRRSTLGGPDFDETCPTFETDRKRESGNFNGDPRKKIGIIHVVFMGRVSSTSPLYTIYFRTFV